MSVQSSEFGHSGRECSFWADLARRALAGEVTTPFFIFSAAAIADAVAELEAFSRQLPVPVRHWFSCKTQPFGPLLRWWLKKGLNIEVVSEFELLAALNEGFPPERVLVNGPAKHRWLTRHALRKLRVNFDSPSEVSALLDAAKSLDWSTGIRFLTTEERDPQDPARPTQFGMTPAEVESALRQLRQAGLVPETAHFHLRTNVPSPAIYERAIIEVASVCRSLGFEPRHLDCGGGWPAPRVKDLEGRFVDAGFSVFELAHVYRRVLGAFPGLVELWLENGRYVCARTGVLVVRVLDVKERAGRRYLICDGGRTTNALVSLWEQHAVLTVPERSGPAVETAICGPTCMAFDQLARQSLPKDIVPGDCLAWLEAGAYHLQWENRFSHGLGAVLWHEDGRLHIARPGESFDSWWGQWR